MKSIIHFFRIFLLLTGLIFATTVFAARHIIEVRDYVFVPDSVVNVEIGDSIVWQWVEGAHTTTSSEIPSGADPWDAEISQLSPVAVYVPNTSGVYRYYCKPHLSMGMMGMFVVKGAEGINERGAIAPDISIYPNPFAEMLTFSYETKGNRLEKVEIYDLTGKKIFEKNEALIPGAENIIHLGRLNPGMYLIKFTDTANKSWARRIDKQR